MAASVVVASVVAAAIVVVFVMLVWWPSHWHLSRVLLAFIVRVWHSSWGSGIRHVGLVLVVWIWGSSCGSGVHRVGIGRGLCRCGVGMVFIIWVWHSSCWYRCGLCWHLSFCRRAGVVVIALAFIVLVLLQLISLLV